MEREKGELGEQQKEKKEKRSIFQKRLLSFYSLASFNILSNNSFPLFSP
jgi:hypothetical protein